MPETYAVAEDDVVPTLNVFTVLSAFVVPFAFSGAVASSVVVYVAEDVRPARSAAVIVIVHEPSDGRVNAHGWAVPLEGVVVSVEPVVVPSV